MNAIQFPTIEVGGRKLVVRYSIASQVLMRRRGIDPTHLLRYISPFQIVEVQDAAGNKADQIQMVDGKPVLNPESQAVENIMTVFSCMVAENHIDQSSPDRFDLNQAPTADYWTSQLHPLQFPEIEAIIGEAMGKVTEARRSNLRVVAPPVAKPAGDQTPDPAVMAS